MRLFILGLLSYLILLSCKKDKNQVRRSFTGDLPIVFTNSPLSVAAGTNIKTSIRCELVEISGTVIFQGFDIQETSPKHFSISAKALYKDWNMQSSLPVIWSLDTSVTIKTATTGNYILNFYNNSSAIAKSDTVIVN